MWSSQSDGVSNAEYEDTHTSEDEMDKMLMEGFGMYDSGALGADDGLDEELELDVDVETYYKLVNDGKQELYLSCQKFSKL